MFIWIHKPLPLCYENHGKLVLNQSDITMYSSPSLNKWYILHSLKKMYFLSNKYGLANTMPQISRGITSRTTSSIKWELMAYLSWHFLVTFNSEFLHTHSSGDGLGWNLVSNPSWLTRFSNIIFDCEPLPINVSIFVCLGITLRWNNASLSFSSWDLL